MDWQRWQCSKHMSHLQGEELRCRSRGQMRKPFDAVSSFEMHCSRRVAGLSLRRCFSVAQPRLPTASCICRARARRGASSTAQVSRPISPVRRKAGVALADLMQRTFQLLVQRKCMAGEDRAKSAFRVFCCDAIAQHCSSAFPEAMGLEF